MCDAENRLGMNGVDEIKAHPFFRGLDWENLRNTKSPFLPEIKDDEDVSRFDKFDEEQPFYPPEDSPGQNSTSKKTRRRKDINFPGYTYKKDVEEQKTKLVAALKGLLDQGEDADKEANLKADNSSNVIFDIDNMSPPEQE